MRIKSPGYPNININEAIGLADRLFTSSRQNVVDREAAAKDLGFTGLTGHSMKMLSNLTHFGLIEKAGKGGLRLTDLAVKVLHPRDSAEKKEALREAAYSPGLFAAIKEQWPDGFVSENALRSYLMRNGFSSVAVAPAISSYMETYSILQQEGATESHGHPPATAHNSPPEAGEAASVPLLPSHQQTAPGGHQVPQPTIAAGVRMMAGERVIFVDEVGQSYLKLIAAGEPDETMLEALEEYVKRQKKRLASAQPKPVN